jgi:tetratricopeptide (TPR) repeat protein
VNSRGNHPCPCGSNRRYRQCCGRKTHARPSRPLARTTALSRLVSLAKDGRHGELEKIARQLLAEAPDAGLLWKFLGLSLWMQGKDAVPALQRAAELLPADVEAHGNLGNALRAAGDLGRAAESHRRALAIDPDCAQAHNNLGSVEQDLGHLDQAIASFRRAVAIRPDFALAHANLGNVLALRNRRDEAEASCRRALEINPRLTTAIVQLAELQADLGRFADAEDLTRGAIAIDRDMPEAWAALARFHKMTNDDAEWLAQAQRIVARPLPARREIHLRYALGKYFDDVGQFEQAFAHFRRANELTRSHRPEYGPQRLTHAIDRIIQSQTREWVSCTRVAGNASERAVFIVGMPRSGTTLAEQILAAHSEVFGAGELPFWNGAAATLVASRDDGGDDGEILSRLAAEYSTHLRELAPEASRVVDKMPANFLHLGMIHAAWPRARIIHMRRHPIDTCLSIYFQNFGAEHFYSNDLDDLAHYYSEYVRLMRHWRRTLPPDAMLEVPYEALVESPEPWSRRIVEFVGLRWDSKCLDFHDSARAISTVSKWQARQKIHRSSVGRWRNYQSFVGPLARLTQEAPE